MSFSSVPLWLPAADSVYQFTRMFTHCFVSLSATNVMKIFDMDRKTFIRMMDRLYPEAVPRTVDLVGKPIPVLVENAWPHDAFLVELHQDPDATIVRYLDACFDRLDAMNGVSKYHFDCLVKLYYATAPRCFTGYRGRNVARSLTWRAPSVIAVALAAPAPLFGLPAATVPVPPTAPVPPAVVSTSDSDRKRLRDAALERFRVERAKRASLKRESLVRLAATDQVLAKHLEEKRLQDNVRTAAYARRKRAEKAAAKALRSAAAATGDDKDAVAALLTLAGCVKAPADPVADQFRSADPVADRFRSADPLVAALLTLAPMPALRADGALLF